MGVIFNVKRATVDKNGEVQRVKYKGVAPLSLAYGLYLGDTSDSKTGVFKAYFLMTSFIPGTGEIINPSEIRTNPRMSVIPLSEFPFSKKFTAAEQLVDSLEEGAEYWFLYTSEATSSPIDGRMITFESLDLVCVADASGADGIKSLLSLFKLKFQQQSA